MFLILLALCVLAVSAAGLGLLAFARPTPATTRLADLFGPLGAACGCALGMAGLFTDSWTGSLLWTQAWGLPVGSLSLGLDALSRVFLLPVFGLGFVCACAGGISLRHTRASEHNLAAHWLFYLLLVLGMAVVMMARDAVLFLLAWEVMSLSPFFLIDFNDSDRNVRDASWVYLVAAHLGAVLLLAFFGLLWQNAGDTAFATLALKEGPVVPLASVLFVLSLLGFGAKAGIAPMHVWLPEAHPAAPSHISALLSGAMINAGLYGIIRSCEFVAPLSAAPAWWGWLTLFLGLGTALMGILKALAQSNLKRLLAYSSVENMGLMLMGVGAWLIGSHSGNSWIGTLGLAGAMFHMLNHSAFKGLLFLTAGEVLHATGTVRMELLGGLQQRMPLVGAAFGIGAVSIACFPPFNGFAGEFVLAPAHGAGGAGPGLRAGRRHLCQGLRHHLPGRAAQPLCGRSPPPPSPRSLAPGHPGLPLRGRRSGFRPLLPLAHQHGQRAPARSGSRAAGHAARGRHAGHGLAGGHGAAGPGGRPVAAAQGLHRRPPAP